MTRTTSLADLTSLLNELSADGNLTDSDFARLATACDVDADESARRSGPNTGHVIVLTDGSYARWTEVSGAWVGR